MRFGVVLPIGSGSVADAARGIEAAGFDSAWVVDAHNRGLLLQDPFAVLAVAASHTSRLEVGSCERHDDEELARVRALLAP